MSATRLINTNMTLLQIHTDLLVKLDTAYAALKAAHADPSVINPAATQTLHDNFNKISNDLWDLKKVMDLA